MQGQGIRHRRIQLWLNFSRPSSMLAVLVVNGNFKERHEHEKTIPSPARSAQEICPDGEVGASCEEAGSGAQEKSRADFITFRCEKPHFNTFGVAQPDSHI